MDYTTSTGLIIELTQAPYIDTINGRTAYFANAVDADHNDYRVIWDITDADCEDESDSCDWTDYTAVKA